MTVLLSSSCSAIEKSAQHGFYSGYYTQTSGRQSKKVYLEVTDDKTTLYPISNDSIGPPDFTLYFHQPDTVLTKPLTFYKTSLDIDITSILLKYRLPTQKLPAQVSTDLNVAVYVGWRRDQFNITNKISALGKKHYEVAARGYDVGFLAGTGSTFIGSSTTQAKLSQEYNGAIIEVGVAAFIETNFASFGIATGFDHLLSSDRSVWVYNKKPWIGFVVGIALN